MPERFDRATSLAIKAALACARRQGADEVGGEHLLVGLIEVLSGQTQSGSVLGRSHVPSRSAAALVHLGMDTVRLEDAVARGAHDARLLPASASISPPYGERSATGSPCAGGPGDRACVRM